MALQTFTDITGSQMYFDPVAKIVYGNGGKDRTQYKSPQEWDTRQQKVHPDRIKGAGNSNPAVAVTSTGQSTGQSGISSLTGTTGQPTIDLNTIYQNAINSPEILALQKEVDTKKQGYNTAITNINDNPFASEATRVGKIAKLDNTAQREINTLEDRLTQRKADAQVKVNIANQQYNINSDQYKNELSKLNMLISSGALLNANGTDLSQIALATGLSTSMLNGIQTKMKSDNVKTQVITNTDNSGKVTVSVVDSNTGKVISQSSLGNIGGANTSGGGNVYKPGTATYIAAVNAMTGQLQSQAGSDLRISPETWAIERSKWIGSGFDDTYALRLQC